MNLLNPLPQRLDTGATPTFTAITAASLTAPTATDLTLAGGSTGASLVLGQGVNANATITPSGTGKILSGTTGSEGGVGLSAFSVGTATGLGGTAYRVSSFYSTAAAAADRPGVILGFDTAGAGVIAAATQATGQPLAFWTYNGSAWGEKMRLATTGNLLIGTTIDGGQKLQVNGTANFTGDVSVSKASPSLNLVNSSGSTVAQFLAQSSVNRSIIVGQFGDSSAGTTLGIANTSAAYLLTATTGVNYPDKLIIGTTGRPAPIYFGTNGTLALTLDGSTQAATFAGAVSIGGNFTLPAAAAATTRYIISAANNDGTIVFQNGIGSAVAGGSLQLSGLTHATRPGWVTVGLGSGSTRKFTVSDIGVPGGTDVFTVDQLGSTTISSTTPSGGAGSGALQVAGGIYAGAASVFGGLLNVSGSSGINIGAGFLSTGSTMKWSDSDVSGLAWSMSPRLGDGVATNFALYAASTLVQRWSSSGNSTFPGSVSIGGNIGFYGQAATAKPTGVAVTAAAIHAALVTLNLISA